MKYAVIDIGSNSVRLMLWADGNVLYKKLSTTRLGAGLLLSGVLSEEAQLRTVETIATFYREGINAGARVYAFATAAVRSAKNGAVFCGRVKEACDLTVDVVSGEAEAELALCGVLKKRDGGIVDIGGASSEVAFQLNGKRSFTHSLPVGAVLLHDTCCDEALALESYLNPILSALDGAKPVGTLYAVGGTASTLASIKRGEAYSPSHSGEVLSYSFVESTAKSLLALSVEERKRIKGMEEKRADVIAGAAYLLAKIMHKLGVGSVVFSDSDNLEGYLNSIVLQQEKE